MSELLTINGAWSEEADAWVSDIVCLQGESWLEVTLPHKGRLVIKKSETLDGPWPKALISDWSGPEFRIHIYGTTESKYIKICLTETPTRIQIVKICKERHSETEEISTPLA